MEPESTQPIHENGLTPKRKRKQASVPRVKRNPKPKLVFEPDIDEPQTIESLAAQQRKFLAANSKHWVDVDLPYHK